MMLAQGFQERGDFAKSTTYLREAIAAEKDAVQKELLLVRLSMTELAAKNPTAAAAAANEAKALNPNNGMAYLHWHRLMRLRLLPAPGWKARLFSGSLTIR